MTSTLQADIWFDLVCPWCAIGKRHFERALEQLAREQPGLGVDTRWHGTQLLPDMPAGGMPFAEFYARRLGGAEAVRARQAQVQEAAAGAGLRIAFERMQTMPNTGAAHRLLAWAEAHGGRELHATLLQRLLDAYFVEGGNIGDRATLARIATACGLDWNDAAPCLDQPMPWVPAPVAAGVPLFVFGQRLAIAGAQAPETLVAGMRQALAPRASGADAART